VTLTYAEVGATRAALVDGAPLPSGYDHVRRHVRLAADFRTAAEALARWQPQRGAGLAVRTDAERAERGVRFATGLGVGPLRLWVPCEIVWFVDEPARFGFGFGTLDGHPERGEEAFQLSVVDGAVWFDVAAFSRPAKWWVRLGQVFARRLQAHVTNRYVRAMERLPR
jgi:uncharacterized protein (UPF0548 family)